MEALALATATVAGPGSRGARGPWPPNELPVDADIEEVGTNTGTADEEFDATPADTPRPDE